MTVENQASSGKPAGSATFAHMTDHRAALSVSSKLPGFGASIFATMTALARQEGAFNLSQGAPDFNPPPKLLELVNKYMHQNENQYAPMPGMPQLREAIADKVDKLYDLRLDAEKEITVTAGATQGIFAVITSILREEDEVIIFEPAYDCYVPSILLNRGKPRYIQLKAPDFHVDWEAVKNTINHRTRAIIINTPHNPTGTLLRREDMLQLQKLTQGTDIIVISDEVYEHITFDGLPHESVCRYPELFKRSFVIFSFGKTYHNTGWKLGYALAPWELTKELRKVFQFMMFSCVRPMQLALAEFMEEEEQHYLSLPDFYQQKRDLFASYAEQTRFKVVPCEGTYFQCLDYSAISDEPDIELAKRLTRDFKLASIPVSPFYHEKTDQKVLRFCFAKSDETLEKAGEILCKI